MKSILISFLSILLFAYTSNGFAQCQTIFLESQAEVDDFVANNNCTVIEGDLRIGMGVNTNTNITDISGLESITSISGSLKILRNVFLPNLDGLQNITNVGGNLDIEKNNSLTNLEALQNLNSIGGYLHIESNSHLSNIAALYNLTNIEGSLQILENDSLSSLNGLQNITSIGEQLEIIENDALINIDALQNLSSIGGELQILENDDLTNIIGLQNLTHIGEFLEIRENDLLVNLDGLENLTNIEQGLNIGLNASLNSLNGLQNITSVGGNLTLELNLALPNLHGLENLTSIGGNCKIYSNILFLENLEGLNNLTTIGGDLDIVDNFNLTNLEGLNNLTTIGERLEIDHNFNLTNLDGLENLLTVEAVEIENNSNLESCCTVLSFLDGIEGTLFIENNHPNCNSVEAIEIACTDFKMQAQAFFDENENGLFDENEQSIPQIFSLSPSASLAYSDNQGLASLYLENFGNYTLTVEEDSLWNVVGGSANIEIAYLDSTFNETLFTFPMSPVEELVIQKVDITSGITRCNQTTNYWITYANTGTTINDGSIKLLADDLATFVSANPPVDSIAGDTLYWFYENLFLGQSNKINLVYEMPGVDFIGEEIVFEVEMQTNEGLGDSKETIGSELICAYDPNDKLVTPEGVGTENYTLFGDTLQYTIRFQNTGNDTAFTVIIEDELSEYLDLNTFRPIASSHNVETHIDLNSRLATFTFNDIYLPDSNVNESGSHGFVKFQILHKEDLAENTDLLNTASIFFDENPPIITNTVKNRLVSELPLQILSNSLEPSFSLFPNPNNGHFHIGSDDVIQFYQIYNSLGVLILEEIGGTDYIDLDLSLFPKGCYFIALKTGSGTFVEKVLIQTGF